MKRVFLFYFLFLTVEGVYSQKLSSFFPEEPIIKSTLLIGQCVNYINQLGNGVVYEEKDRYVISREKYDDFQIQYSDKNMVAGNLYFYCFYEYLVDSEVDLDQLYTRVNYKFIFDSSSSMYLIGYNKGHKPGLSVFVLDSTGLLIHHYMFSENKVNYRNLGYLDRPLKRLCCNNNWVKNKKKSRRFCRVTGYEITSIKVITNECNRYLVNRKGLEFFYRKEHTSDFFDIKLKEFQRIMKVLNGAKYDDDFVAFDYQGVFCSFHLIYLITGKENSN